jgi:hypothetical protein
VDLASELIAQQFFLVQALSAGRIAPKTEEDGTFTITWEQGFIETAGFDLMNPPDATVLVEVVPGRPKLGVLKLSNLRYDPRTRVVTYDARLVSQGAETG